VIAAAVIGCLLVPAAASATTRYAAPGGTATAAQCTTPATPCTINEAAAGAGVLAADEVVVEQGNYSDTAGDLGVDGEVHPIAGNIHGVLGQPRPEITLDSSHGFGAIDVSPGITVSYLSIQSTISDRAIFIGGGTVDGVIARGTGSFGASCQHQNGILRNSACISTASGGTAVGVAVGTSGALTSTLRNVTAIATGSGSFAASYRVVGTGSITLSVKGVIAQGVAGDIRASASGGGATTITVDHSNFDTTDVSLGGGTITSGGDNQTSASMLAPDNVHQLSGSPTINAGAVDGSSGTTDVDGQQRTIDTVPDIGADEVGHPTTTAVSCTPNPILVGTSTTCSVTVIDTAATGATNPQGTVEFSTDTAEGVFEPGPSCPLDVAGESGGECQVTYTPGVVGTGTQQISATYGGDTAHDGSSGSDDVGVTEPDVVPPPSGGGPSGGSPSSNSPAIKKKCKKKKHKRSASAAKKKKCKKKKRR
jgi:hypothetical protein